MTSSSACAVSTFGFDEINDAVAAMESGRVIKPVILFD
jgi:hypothetical protein